MSVQSLRRRHSQCKICCCFHGDMLEQITADILLRRKTYKELKAFYDPLLPKTVRPLNDPNINNHRKHSDPVVFAKEALMRSGEPVTDVDVICQLYVEYTQKKLDHNGILREIYRERLKNLEGLQTLLNKSKKQLKEIDKILPEDANLEKLMWLVKAGAQGIPEDDPAWRRLQGKDKDPKELLEYVRRGLQNDIRSATQQIDNIQAGIQKAILQEHVATKEEHSGVVVPRKIVLEMIKTGLNAYCSEVLAHAVLYYPAKSRQEKQQFGEQLILMLEAHMAKTMKFLSSAGDEIIEPHAISEPVVAVTESSIKQLPT